MTCSPEGAKRRSSLLEVAAAQKLRPAATQHASSPAGNPRLQSLFAAHESNGRHTSVLGASGLERLAYSAPCAIRAS